MAEVPLGKILLAYDGSEGAEKALDLARTLARRFSAKVLVVVAFSQLPRVSSPSAEDMQHIHESRDVAERIAKLLQSEGIEAESDVLEGPPADAILNASEAHDIDMIVVGSRGYGQFRGLLLGSVSDRIVHYANKPVLVAR